MDRYDSYQSLIQAAQSGVWSRRQILKRAIAVGLSAPALTALLAACETEDGTDDTEDEETPEDEAAAEDEETEEEEEATEEEDEEETATPDEEEEDEETPESDDQAAEGEGQQGGTLVIAAIGEPSTLDEHTTTASITGEIAYCFQEGLFAYDENWEPAPMLAESYEVSDDGTQHTITLRQGVPFHNGDEMTSEDVVASIERWGSIGGVGENLLNATESLEATDDYTIEWVTSTSYGTILVALSNNTQGCTIFPASVMEGAGSEPVSEGFIGTGPYRLVEHVPDRHILLERFEDYAAKEGGTNGYAGHKYQYVDQIEFVPVPDESSRVSGAQSGDYHILMEVSNDQYEPLSDEEGLMVEILPPAYWDVFFVNWESPLMGDENMRKAFQACLDHEAIMESARAGGDFVELHPGFMLPPTPWVSDAGEDLYNINDPELAAQYLEDAGYDGTPVRFMSTQEYPSMYNGAIVAVQQMEDAGFTVENDVVDWATVLERRAEPDAWDIFVTWHGFVPDPSQITMVGQRGDYPGWWTDEEFLELSEQFLQETDTDTRMELWEEIQLRAYETVPCIKLGNASTIAVWSQQVGGYTGLFQNGIPYWNLWLEEQ